MFAQQDQSGLCNTLSPFQKTECGYESINISSQHIVSYCALLLDNVAYITALSKKEWPIHNFNSLGKNT